jgi:hypothetical protein
MIILLLHSRFSTFLSFSKRIYNVMLAIACSSVSCSDALTGMTKKLVIPAGNLQRHAGQSEIWSERFVCRCPGGHDNED